MPVVKRKPVDRKLDSLGLKVKVFKPEKNMVLAYSPGMKRFVKRNEGLLTSVHQLIQENFRKIQKGKRVINDRKKIAIQRKLTGSYKGGSYDVKRVDKTSFNVQTEKNMFFVKIVRKRPEVIKTITGMKLVDKWLKKKKNKVGKFKVEIIKPLLFFEKENRSYQVSKFYKPEEVKQIRDIEGKKASELIETMKFIEKELGKTGQQIREINPKNAFYNNRTNTILLYDIYTKSA